MSWSAVGELIARTAPMLGTLLGGPGGGAVGGMVAAALGMPPESDTIAQALRADPQLIERLRRLELEHESDLARLTLESEAARLTQINMTMRAEAASLDPYVRRWRPTFGYLTAVAWLAQAMAIAWVVVAQPEQAGHVAQAITALTPMWGIALTVLGVSVSARSRDKQTAAGSPQPPGLIGVLTARITGGGNG